MKLVKNKAKSFYDKETFNITKEELSENLGTSIRNINRLLKDLLERGIISYSKDRSICILSKDKLLKRMREFE